MFKFFHEKLVGEMRREMELSPINESFSSEIKSKVGEEELYRHYCYFLMTNLIFEELHNKFTSINYDI